jgi:hypothetical protein
MNNTTIMTQNTERTKPLLLFNSLPNVLHIGLDTESHRSTIGETCMKIL